MKPFEESDRYLYDLTPDSVVLDCGGYEGRWADGINEKYHCHIHIFEPIAKFCFDIQRRFAREPKINVYNIGVGGSSGIVPFKIKGDMTGAYADNPETEWVNIQDVNEVFERLKLTEMALMKLNVEGSEFPIIEKMLEKGLLSCVLNLQVQWHAVVPDYQARYDALQMRLAESHELTFEHGWIWQNWRLRK